MYRLETLLQHARKPDQARIADLVGHLTKHDDQPFNENTCWSILNLYNQQYEYVSQGSKLVFGLEPDEVRNMDLFQFMEGIEPDDAHVLQEYTIPELLKVMDNIPIDERKTVTIQLNYVWIRPNGQHALILNFIRAVEINDQGTIQLVLVKSFEIDFPRKSPGIISTIKSYKDPSAPERLFMKRYFPYAWMRELSEREIEILSLILAGESSHVISEQLYISRNTVDTHRRNILKKLGAKSSTDLLVKLFGTHLKA